MSNLRKIRQPFVLLTAAGVAGALALGATAEAKTLRIGAQADAGTMDPHAQNIQTTISVLSMVYEALVTRDKSLRKAPQLAVDQRKEVLQRSLLPLTPAVQQVGHLPPGRIDRQGERAGVAHRNSSAKLKRKERGACSSAKLGASPKRPVSIRLLTSST